jgi:membrane protein YdbS with pleckstrin-like domain
MENQLNQINDPKLRNRLYFYIIWLRTKEAIKGITPTSLILLVFSIIFASMIYKGENNFQEIGMLFVFTVVAIILLFVIVISSSIFLPTLNKKKISKWDSKYFSDSFTFLIMQIVFGIHAYFLAQTHDKPFLELFIVSFLLSVIGLLLTKLYIWVRWGRHRE